MSNEWTPETEQYLRDYYPTTGTSVVRDVLRDTYGLRKAMETIRCKARDMGVYKDPAFVRMIRGAANRGNSTKHRQIIRNSQRISHPSPGVTVHRLIG